MPPPALGLLPYKKPHLFKDLVRLAKFHGNPFNTPSELPRLTVKPLRALLGLPKEELPESVHRLYRAYWVEDRDISDSAVLEDLVCVETVEKTGNPEIKKALIAATDEALNRGLFVAPSFLVGEELFFGHDRMELLDAHLKGKL